MPNNFFFSFCFAGGLENSMIVRDNEEYLTLLSKWLEPVIQQSSSWNRCYQATVNGWSSYTFHSCCDGLGPTVTIIRVGKYIFGGYTSQSWSEWHDTFKFFLSFLSPAWCMWVGESHPWQFSREIHLASVANQCVNYLLAKQLFIWQLVSWTAEPEVFIRSDPVSR